MKKIVILITLSFILFVFNTNLNADTFCYIHGPNKESYIRIRLGQQDRNLILVIEVDAYIKDFLRCGGKQYKEGKLTAKTAFMNLDTNQHDICYVRYNYPISVKKELLKIKPDYPPPGEYKKGVVYVEFENELICIIDVEVESPDKIKVINRR